MFRRNNPVCLELLLNKPYNLKHRISPFAKLRNRHRLVNERNHLWGKFGKLLKAPTESSPILLD